MPFDLNQANSAEAVAMQSELARLRTENAELVAALDRSLHQLTEGDETMWRHPESPYYFIGELLARIERGTP